jgi:hypothetical protein
MGSKLKTKSTRARGRSRRSHRSPITARASGLTQGDLRILRSRLQLVQSSALVVAAALKGQNCEMDADAARILFRHVADGLTDPLGTIEAAMEAKGHG